MEGYYKAKNFRSATSWRHTTGEGERERAQSGPKDDLSDGYARWVGLVGDEVSHLYGNQF